MSEETKTTKYAEFLALSKDAAKAIKRPFQVNKAKNQLRGEIIDIEEEVATYDLDIVEAKGKYPFELNTILTAVNKKELAERKLRQAKALMAELF